MIPAKPDGTPRKLMDSSLIQSLGWRATTGLEEGLQMAYEDFCRLS
jgi:GDP-L-fucose synthase